MVWRRRKKKALLPAQKNYRFFTNSSILIIKAETLEEAKHKFQAIHGFWPEKGVNYVRAQPEAGSLDQADEGRAEAASS